VSLKKKSIKFQETNSPRSGGSQSGKASNSNSRVRPTEIQPSLAKPRKSIISSNLAELLKKSMQDQLLKEKGPEILKRKDTTESVEKGGISNGSNGQDSFERGGANPIIEKKKPLKGEKTSSSKIVKF
jgi:hypothetical protein